jgi:hypothetical protein
MSRVDRLTYAKSLIISRAEYTDVHGIIEAWGGRVKDCQYNWENDDMIIFYEMAKNHREFFEKELYEFFSKQELEKQH